MSESCFKNDEFCDKCWKSFPIKVGTRVKTKDGFTGTVEMFWEDSDDFAWFQEQGRGAEYSNPDKILVSYDEGQMISGHDYVYRTGLTHVECSR